jgi:hypothetical protein
VNKNVNIILGLFVAIILLAGAFSGGFIVGHLLPAAGQIPFLSEFSHLANGGMTRNLQHRLSCNPSSPLLGGLESFIPSL